MKRASGTAISVRSACLKGRIRRLAPSSYRSAARAMAKPGARARQGAQSSAPSVLRSASPSCAKGTPQRAQNGAEIRFKPLKQAAQKLPWRSTSASQVRQCGGSRISRIFSGARAKPPFRRPSKAPEARIQCQWPKGASPSFATSLTRSISQDRYSRIAASTPSFRS